MRSGFSLWRMLAHGQRVDSSRRGSPLRSRPRSCAGSQRQFLTGRARLSWADGASARDAQAAGTEFDIQDRFAFPLFVLHPLDGERSGARGSVSRQGLAHA